MASQGTSWVNARDNVAWRRFARRYYSTDDSSGKQYQCCNGIHDWASQRHFVVNLNGREHMNSLDQKPGMSRSCTQATVRASGDLIYSTLIAPLTPALLLIFVPRSQFESQSLLKWIALICEAWPKMAKDAQRLGVANSSFVSKYVISVSAIIAVSSIIFLVSLLRFVFTAVLNGDIHIARSSPSKTARNYALLIGVFLLLSYWIFVFPTPFRFSGGLSGRYPAYELAFFYWAMFLGALYCVTACFVSAVLVGVGDGVQS